MKLSKIPFSATGSLYLLKDIASGARMPLCKGTELEEHKEFCFGPTADYMFWYGRIAAMNLNRGPWQNPADYLKSRADKEIEWTHLYGKPIEPDFPYNAMGLGVQQPEDFSQLLRQYQTITPHLPPEDPAHHFNQLVLCHPDRTPGYNAIIQPHILTAGYPWTFECSNAEAVPMHIAQKVLV
ncbi:hypothetical protein BDU57DRAFT_540752 [Ampelomyces quisqualis]|uniref:Uncharacterized protein n=1 Tax=Ampelomyces quisqualis TaxID=50730 RepID=A0A6A5QHL0_AMPQU|nr:hypothetical protein BDU57DRAFT_540752 [Ampelomyces quisqualis]